MTLKSELCTSCGMPIGQHAAACVWRERVVCAPCHQRLAARHQQPSRRRWWFAGAGALLTAAAATGLVYLKTHTGQ